MPQLSDEMLRDIAEAHSPEEIVEILDLESIDLLLSFRDRVREQLTRFDVRPIDCHEI
tara:strand:- start:1037 stop:1210 length:174 start_codon:yes stop_codon:yes gene_type:complete